MQTYRKVIVEASTEYAVLIGHGLLAQAGAEIAKRIRPCRAAVIADETVAGLYAAQVEESLRGAGFSPCRFTFPAGEASKNIRTLSDILEFLANEGLTRQDILVAPGGGVCGDMVGFAAAIYQRGIRYIQLPTTLLAAVDSSVGGKTAINLAAGKNLAGAFYQPHLVLCDVDTLESLPAAIFADGAAEVLKYGMIGDAALFERAAGGDFREDLAEIIEVCVKMKRDIVREDEFDTGVRQLLNLGHTFAHAIEKQSDFSISHGQAVGIGLHLIACAAEKRGFAEAGLAEKIKQALRKNHLPFATAFSAAEILAGMMQDKKRRGDEICFVVPKKIGSCEMLRLSLAEAAEWVRDAKEESE